MIICIAQEQINDSNLVNDIDLYKERRRETFEELMVIFEEFKALYNQIEEVDTQIVNCNLKIDIPQKYIEIKKRVQSLLDEVVPLLPTDDHEYEPAEATLTYKVSPPFNATPAFLRATMFQDVSTLLPMSPDCNFRRVNIDSILQLPKGTQQQNPLVESMYTTEFRIFSNRNIVFGLWSPYFSEENEDTSNFVNLTSTCTSKIKVKNESEPMNGTVTLKNVMAGVVQEQQYNRFLVLMNSRKPVNANIRIFHILFNRYKILNSNESLIKMLQKLDLPSQLVEENKSKQFNLFNIS